MKRNEMINIIGSEYLESNLETGEFSYESALKKCGANWNDIKIKNEKTGGYYKNLDIRFVNGNISILVETKQNFTKDVNAAEEQLSAYVQYEKLLTGNKIIAILANTSDDKIKVWRGIVSDSNYLPSQTILRPFNEYVDEFYTSKVNNKEKVMKNTYDLNELLHSHGISEKLRSQFVGTCLLALKNGLDYKNPKLSTRQIIAGIKEILEDLLNKDINKASKLSLLNDKILKNQDVRDLDVNHFKQILKAIDENILPFINDKSTAGQDLLNLFFITFNKYVGKADKNQAFTPDHITDFMAKITGVNKHTSVLDPCCGSGAFLVRAMTQALDDCVTVAEQENVKKNHIYGIEFEESAYGLSTTNMLIHGDGNSNIVMGSCFDFESWIKDANPDVILMNPPYNAQKKHMPKEYTDTWSSSQKEDPSKGLYFVKYIADIINKLEKQATLAVLLPVACAIGSSKEIEKMKEALLQENTLDAVFTLPNEVFYPGASASACCMVFKLGKKHSDPSNPDTFFGYFKDDGFKKKKNLGRVEQLDENGNSKWVQIEKEWINLYRNRKEKDGISATQKVSYKDEWLCEAYMKTDYSNINSLDFQHSINDFYAFLITSVFHSTKQPTQINTQSWKEYRIGDIFLQERGKEKAPNQNESGEIPLINEIESNNGFTRKVEPTQIFKGNAISVSINFGKNVFYQPFDFCASVNIVILRNPNLNQYNGLFIATIIRAENARYSYGYKTSKERINDTIIKLPSTSTGEPDWQWMEDYIKSLPYSDKL